MKSQSSIKIRCNSCQIIKRQNRRFVYCSVHPRHKQRQA